VKSKVSAHQRNRRLRRVFKRRSTARPHGWGYSAADLLSWDRPESAGPVLKNTSDINSSKITNAQRDNLTKGQVQLSLKECPSGRRRQAARGGLPRGHLLQQSVCLCSC
jgi:hypothetical protein